MAAFTLYRITFDPIKKCSFSLAFTLYRITFDPIKKCSFSLAFTLYRKTFDLVQKCSFSLAFTLYRYSFGAVQVQNCSSFPADTKLYLIAGTKLYRITLSSVNAWLIRKTFVSDQKVIWYSVNAALLLFLLPFAKALQKCPRDIGIITILEMTLWNFAYHLVS